MYNDKQKWTFLFYSMNYKEREICWILQSCIIWCPQALTSLSTEMMELLRSLHVHTIKDEEILLLKNPKRPFERKDSVSQVWFAYITLEYLDNVYVLCETCLLLSLFWYQVSFIVLSRFLYLWYRFVWNWV